ncbi:acyltransferase [Fontisphaera persica]|uniref:acyltransferase n=1 Tax=Fontisphaera persica TaxID=2974023 RepID=UPI0024C0CA3F|nr:acyltransferase [Fontisphaera persica]WCJ59694.1 acyltransferase [Fontisphaera persica]
MNVTTFCHPDSLVEEGAVVGKNTRVWAFAHVCKGAIIGDYCNICDHTFIEKGVVIGNRVTIKSGVYLWDGIVVENDVFIGPCAAFTNDMRPRSKQYPPEYLKTILRQGCSIGANATILPGLEIGRWAMVGAGAVVTKSVPDFGLVYGNPARLQGYVCECGCRLQFENQVASCQCGKAYQIRNNIVTHSKNP